MSARGAAALLALACAASACGSTAAPAQPALRHAVTFDADLRSARVLVAIEGGTPRALRVARPRAIEGAVALPSGAALVTDGAGLAALPPGTDAVRYTVRLAALAATRDAEFPAAGLLVDPETLLVRAADGPARRIRARLSAAGGAHVVAPWAAGGGEHDVPPSVFDARGMIAVTPTPPLRVEAGGAVFDVAVLGPRAASDADLVRWLSAAAAAALPLGGDARPRHVQALVLPVRGASEPVLFGETFYGGGPALRVLLGGAARGDELPGEWVAVHELSHLALPRVRQADAWFAEGLATYYQEVLRCRAGVFDEAELWSRLRAGFARGAPGAGRDTLRRDSELMGARHGYLRVYWSGAALALAWDVRLRSEHGRSLDDALRAAARRFPPGAPPSDVAEILAALDAWLGAPFFAPSAGAALDARAFPDVAATLRDLGADGALPRDDAPLAAVRRAIAAPPRGSR